MSCILLALAACNSAERAIAPDIPETARLARGTNQSLTEAFINAQGTYCVRDIPGDCDVIDAYGLGYIFNWCALSCADGPILTADFAGVNRRWWDLNVTGFPAYDPYSYTGGVTESRLSDGRRRLVVNIHARNTFVGLFSQQQQGVVTLLGADALEYPGISSDPKLPVLGDVSLSMELLLPATFQGMPDVTQLFFLPEEGMEVRRMTLTITTSGALSAAYDGIAAGTEVNVRGHFVYLPKLATKPVGSRRMIARGYETSSSITVKAAKAP